MREIWEKLKKVYGYGKPWKANLIWSMVLSFAYIAIHVIYPVFTAKQITHLTGGVFWQLFVTSLVIFGFDILGAFRIFFIRRNTQVFFRGTLKKLQMTACREILGMKADEFDRNSSGVFIERLNKDCTDLSQVFTKGTGNLTAILSSLGIFVAVLIVDWRTFLFYVLTSLTLTFLNLKKVRAVTAKDKELRQQQERNTGLIGELVRGVRDIRMLHAREPFLSTVSDSTDAVSDRIFDERNTEMRWSLLISIVTAVFELALIALLILLASGGHITVASAVVLFSYKANLMNNLIGKINEFTALLKSFDLAAGRVFDVIDGDVFAREDFGTKELTSPRGGISFENVTFRYGDNAPVLKGMNFSVAPGESIGIVGKSGAGKTTLFSLISRLYDPEEGRVTLDGIDIKELTEESLRSPVAVIRQNPYLFHMSIRDNLALVKSNLTESEKVRACRLACLDDFIEGLPDKYDTMVGEGGVNLSGGQRQRLAIARAFLQDAKVTLFDEATSALDNETQAKIRQAIDRLKDSRTILIIAHRLSTVVNCDRILFLEGGRITGEGTHAELLKSCEGYRELYESENEE